MKKRTLLLTDILVLIIALAAVCRGAEPPTVNVVVTVVQTNATPSPMPPRVIRIESPTVPDPIPSLAAKMRLAAKMDESQLAPWRQRFIATRVTEDARTRDNGMFTTNYAVTLLPISDIDTNAPVLWGTVKAGTIRVWSLVPLKQGDELEMFLKPTL